MLTPSNILASCFQNERNLTKSHEKVPETFDGGGGEGGSGKGGGGGGGGEDTSTREISRRRHAREAPIIFSAPPCDVSPCGR